MTDLTKTITENSNGVNGLTNGVNGLTNGVSKLEIDA